MRRKVIKQGASTLTLSLPARWAQRYNLKPGDEVEVLEQGQRLVISTSKGAGPQRRELDLSGISKLSKRIVEAKYVEGCKEVDIKVENREQARDVLSRLKSLQGLEVIEHGRDRLRIKDIAGPQDVEIEPLVHRMFHMLSTMTQETIESLKATDRDVEYIEEMEEGINRLWDVCSRTINCQGLESYAHTTSMYVLLFLLEATADELKDALGHIRRHSVTISKETIHLLEGALQFIRQLEDLTFHFSIKKAEGMAATFDLLSLSIDGRIHKASPEEAVVMMHIRNMMEYLVWGMNQALVVQA